MVDALLSGGSVHWTCRFDSGLAHKNRLAPQRAGLVFLKKPMIKNIIFDFGAVLVDWNPHYLFDSYFGSKEKADWFLANICTAKWNGEVDRGMPISEAVKQLSEVYPEWATEIDMYFNRWLEMMGGEIPGMYELIQRLKSKGYGVYGLTNWSAETFCLVRHMYAIFDLMDGMVVSGEEHLLKPEPEIFHCLFGRYGLEPSECIFTDDNEANVDGARRVGLTAIRFRNAAQFEEELVALGVL